MARPLTIESAVPVSSSIHGARIRGNVSGRSIKRKWPGDIPRETDVLARLEIRPETVSPVPDLPTQDDALVLHLYMYMYVRVYIYTHTHAHTRVHIPLSTREKMLRWKIFPPPNYRDYSGSSSQTNYDQRIRSIFIFSRNRSVSPTYVAVSGSFEAKLLFPSFSLVGRPRVQPACTYLLAYSLATRYVARSRPCLRVHVGPSEVMAQKPTPTTLAG